MCLSARGIRSSHRAAMVSFLGWPICLWGLTSTAFFSSSPSGTVTGSVQLPRILALSSGRCTTTPAFIMLGLLQSSGMELLSALALPFILSQLC